ncbi:MAG: hypothetical protein GVY22_04890 [Gammaproteobacteria bacterium]|nr:hypothetical protein [Gammaproteobacteria bacterium]
MLDWLDSLPDACCRQVRQILEQGVRAASGSSADAVGIRLVAEPRSDWAAGRLCLDDALRLLQTPLGVMVENRRADWRFLLALAPPVQRDQLQHALDQGWLEILHAGGLGDMKAWLEELLVKPFTSVSNAARLLRLWVMFDRDADSADRSQPSQASIAMKTLCESAPARPWPLGHYQLGRRAIENYLPVVAIAELARRLNSNGPDQHQFGTVNRWFWATTYGEYFTGMPGNRIRDAIDALCQAVIEGSDPIPSDLVREVAPIRTFNFRATRSKALALHMIWKIADEQLRERTQRALGEQGVDAVHRLFAGRDAMCPENRIVALPEELQRVRTELTPRSGILSLGNESRDPSAQREEMRGARGHLLPEYLIPPDTPVAFDVLSGEIPAAVDRILTARRTLIDDLERDFLDSLGFTLGSPEATS